MNILSKNLLILASAGSGKTFQLGNRVIGLVARGIAPERIVALTFTRKAAGEFADAVLNKLAGAAGDPKKADALRIDLALDRADFGEALERVVRALPSFTLGTMDGFFAKVVRGFQYELGLTGGKFDLLEGPRAVAAADELLAEILGRELEGDRGEEFLQAFRRATVGKEGLGVREGVRGFVGQWQGRYRETRRLEWGPAWLAGVSPEDWEKHKHELAARAARGMEAVDFPGPAQRVALEEALENLAAHAIGSGSLGNPGACLKSIMESVATDGGTIRAKFRKEFSIGGTTGEALREMVDLAARCEMAAALQRTRAVREVVALYDALCEKRLRRRGMLGFDDIKRLMGGWVGTEDARLRREAVDFRLDARYDHWLLDEFQDTSRADWMGLLPLIDEAAGEGEGSTFIVGDRKQAIYAWRGGEVGLFDEVMHRYEGRLEIESMAESWRSCAEVLSLVNRVCGDLATMRELFGGAADLWQWEEHHPAAPLPSGGESRVEVVEGKWPERLERLGGLLHGLEIGKRALTCGVLVRSNDKVRDVADHLRAAGFDVVEEGRREPAKDHPVGIALAGLLAWLADPGDHFSRELVLMSPLASVISVPWQKAWEGLSAKAAEAGFSAMVEEIIAPCRPALSAFGARRADDILAALSDLDASGGATPKEAADWLRRLEVSQSPGAAAVQVMTIHKSKGLGFDVVVLPDIPNDSIPATEDFTVAEGPGWITQTPPVWARNLLPEMREAEILWAADQRYQGFCTLYVALTRAKRGLYILLEPPAKTADPAKPSLANWLATSIGGSWQSGSNEWMERAGSPAVKVPAANPTALGNAVPKRERATPSGTKKRATSAGSPAAMKAGGEIHRAFESVGWIDEEPLSKTGTPVREIANSVEFQAVFQRRGRVVTLHREQTVDAVIDGKWWSGAIDRLHVHRDALGLVSLVEVIDFKTDVIAGSEILLERYGEQMEAYQKIIGLAFPGAEIRCLLLSTHLRKLVEFRGFSGSSPAA